jgi:hypothetical protein
LGCFWWSKSFADRFSYEKKNVFNDFRNYEIFLIKNRVKEELGGFSSTYDNFNIKNGFRLFFSLTISKAIFF